MSDQERKAPGAQQGADGESGAEQREKQPDAGGTEAERTGPNWWELRPDPNAYAGAPGPSGPLSGFDELGASGGDSGNAGEYQIVTGAWGEGKTVADAQMLQASAQAAAGREEQGAASGGSTGGAGFASDASGKIGDSGSPSGAGGTAGGGSSANVAGVLASGTGGLPGDSVSPSGAGGIAGSGSLANVAGVLAGGTGGLPGGSGSPSGAGGSDSLSHAGGMPVSGNSASGGGYSGSGADSADIAGSGALGERLSGSGTGSRTASIARRTNETDISLTFSVDGSGRSEIETDVPFLNHMLDLFTKHGQFDLQVSARGDVDIDDHHTVEDIGICLGQTLREALGDKRGIKRYASVFVPMDEALAQVVIDISNRPHFEYRAQYPSAQVGSFQVELVHEFLWKLALEARITLHVIVHYGLNTHHMIEAVFKALGRAIDEATSIDPRVQGVPSTKGVL